MASEQTSPQGPTTAVLTRSTVWRLALLAQESTKLLEETLRPFGLRWRDWAVLAVLEERGPLPQNRIGQVLGIDRSTMVGLIDSLENAGLVSRERSRTDRRAYAVVLTDEGRRIIQRVLRPLTNEVQSGLLHRLDESEHALLDGLLEKAMAAWQLPGAR
jgi:DNA-binding MarR family transcriptional regulator